MNRNGKLSIILASLSGPLTLTFAYGMSAYLKGSNPESVDVSAGLAYLGPILIIAFLTLIGLSLVSLISGIMGIKNDEDKSIAKLGIILLASGLILFFLSINFINKNSKIIENSYKAKIEAAEKNN